MPGKKMQNISGIIIRCLVSAILVLGTIMPASAGEERAYTLAVIPSAPPITLHKQWTPFIERLSRETGLEFRLKMYSRMAEFERDIWSGSPDFIFSSPIQEVVAHKAYGYLPLLRGGRMVAIGLYVRHDSPVRSIDDLAGKKISFVGNKNLCSVYFRHLLAQHKNKLSYSNEYAGSTRNVIINVLLGKSDAGAVFVPELAAESEETRNQIRELLVTPDIAPHPLSAHPRVPKTAQEAVKKAVLAIAATKDGAELVKTIKMESPVVANYERDYRAMEVIDVKGLTNWGQ